MFTTYIEVAVTWPTNPPLEWPRQRRYLVPNGAVRNGGRLVFEYGPKEDTRQLDLVLQPIE